MDLQTIFSRFNSGALQAHSELGTRDESKQTKSFGTRIQKMKTVTGINARVLVMKDVVLPFNPFTCEPDDTYNAKHPFRPILLVSQVIEGIKDACAKDADLAAKWEQRLGYKFAEGPATIEDYNALKRNKYIYPRIMSYATVTMSFGESQGFSKYPQKFMVDPAQLNENNTYDYGPDAPIWHKAAVCFNAILAPEADAVEARLKAEAASKETISQQRSAIFSKSPVKFVKPTNLIPFFYFPLNEAPKQFDAGNFKDVEQYLRYYSMTQMWTVPLSELRDNPLYDTDIDFYDCTIKTPSSREKKTDGSVYTDADALALSQAMTLGITDGRIALHGGYTVVEGVNKPNEEVFASFKEAARAYFLYSQEESGREGGETFEKIMAASNRFRPITTVMDKFLPACKEVFMASFATSPYFTPAIKEANSDFLISMNPDNALAFASVDQEDLDEASAKQEASISSIIKETTGDSADVDHIEELDLEDIEEG